MRYKYSREDIEKAVSISKNLHDVLLNLGMNGSGGGGYLTLKKRILEYGISIEHFTGQSWSKGRKLNSKRPIEFYLTDNPIKYINSHALKLRLIKEQMFEKRCNRCGLEIWMEKIYL